MIDERIKIIALYYSLPFIELLGLTKEQILKLYGLDTN